MTDLYPPVQGIHCCCRTCGALCTPEGYADRGGVCARCAYPLRVTVDVHRMASARDPLKELERPGPRTVYMNGREVIGENAIAHALRARYALPVYEPDPIRDAIDRAAADWARDVPEG